MKELEKCPEVVISGISGRFPESGSVKEFISNLLEGRDLVTSNSKRFRSGIYGLPKGFGTLKEIDKFDAEFFGVLPRQAEAMDPQLRIGLETTYEAIFDAGVNPVNKRGSRTGVFTAIMTHEALDLWSRNPDRMDGANLIGSLGTMLPNRISYCLDFNGPSVSYDTACSSSISAMDAAVTAIQTGKCDSAVVMGACLVINPCQSVMRNQAGLLAKDSVTRSFDADGLGYVRAEAVATIYLQKITDARKAYAAILGIGTNTDGYKEKGVFHPSATMQERLFAEVYSCAGIDPGEVTYLEAHGTGTPAGDPEEATAVGRYFCLNQRQQRPLLLGSVKSNIGHTEAAAGLCGIAKIVGILQSGIIPANINYKKPHDSMEHIKNGNIKVVDKNMEFTGGLIGMNCFGFGGVNTHLILKPLLGKNLSNGHNDIPSEAALKSLQLITLSGGTQAGVEKCLKELLDTADNGQLYLLKEINRTWSQGKFRGYAILGSENKIDVVEAPLERPQLWFVLNGMGSQWIGMGRSLLKIPVFQAAFEKCCDTLMPYGYKLSEIYFSNDPDVFNSPTNAFTCIAATQIGLIDILRTLSIKPDGMLGHSMGETLCAYADGCMTLQETILSNYLRGTPCEALKINQNATYGMAAVALSSVETSKILPSGLYISCHNAPESTTISGPLELIDQLTSNLSKFGAAKVKVVNSCGLAFHSQYVATAADDYINLMQPFLKNSTRSQSWISTSIPEENWVKEGGTFGCDYLRNSFLSPVLFNEALTHIPDGAIVIEIGPSGLLRGLIKKGTKDTTVIPLQNRNEDGILTLQNALGRLFQSGINFDMNKLTGEEIETPVPGSTPLLGHLVDWDHSNSWRVPDYSEESGSSGGKFDVCLAMKEDAYLGGHVICGKILYPAAGYLYMVWKHFAAKMQLNLQDVPVVFEDVQFIRATVMGSAEITKFDVNLLPADGVFEVKEGGTAVCSGRIRALKFNEEKIQESKWSEIQHAGITALSNIEQTLTTNDIYKRLRFLGYEYTGQFKGILKVDPSGSHFLTSFKSNWISFIDTMLQTTFRIYSGKDHMTNLSIPTGISKLLINPAKFEEQFASLAEAEKSAHVYVNYDPNTHLIKCKGIEIEGLKMTKLNLNRTQVMPTIISHHAFEPYQYKDADEYNNDKCTPLLHCVSIVMENLDRFDVRTPTIFEICTKGQLAETLEITKLIQLHFAKPNIDYTMCVDDISEGLARTLNTHTVKVQSISEAMTSAVWTTRKYDLVLLDDPMMLDNTIGQLRNGGFLILKCPRRHKTFDEISEYLLRLEGKFYLIAHKFSQFYDVFLIRQDTQLECKEVDVISVDTSANWVESLAAALIRQEAFQMKGISCPRLYLVSTGEHAVNCGLLGLTQCIRKEPFSRNVRCIYSTRPANFDFKNPNDMLQKILADDLVFNVIDDSARSGCYIHSEISSDDRLTSATSAFIDIKTPGDLASLGWNEGVHLETLPVIPGLVPVTVFAAALNFQDMMICSGNSAYELSSKFPHCHQSPLGLEFAGITHLGRRVCGITKSQGIATQVLATEKLVWDIPRSWTFEDAATIPIAYSTAYLALVLRGQIRKNESVLIHLGAGAVGIAAIRIALSYNCQVFTTAGSDKKIAFLRSVFSEIPESNFGGSRDSRFEQLVRSETKGRGVDLVLNSVTGSSVDASIRCLAEHGRFLEIGRIDLIRNKKLGTDVFLRGATFHGINLDLFLNNAHESERKALINLVSEGIDSGVVRPLPFRAFLRDEVEPAFRYLGQGTQPGKVVITIRRDGKAMPGAIKAKRKIYFSPTKSYIILGGLGGVGLELINWMTLRNARHILITSRTGNLEPYSRSYLKIWRERGIDVHVIARSAVVMEDAKDIFREAMALGPIGGIFNLTLHLDVKLMKFHTTESFQCALGPKITATQNLDVLSRNFCPDLDHFVIFSSSSSGMGFDGQGNYAFGNSGAERLIQRRVQDGYPGRAIQWGPIGEVGAWHNIYNKEESPRTDFFGTGVQSVSSVLRSLDLLLTIPGPPVTFCRKQIGLAVTNVVEQNVADFNLIQRIAHILGHSSASKLNKKHKLVDLGLDSIMSIEVTQVLGTDFGLELSAAEIRGYTLEQLNEISNNSRSERATISASLPKVKSVTAGLVQLNLFKSISRSRFVQTEAIYPINALANDGVQHPHGTVLICNSLEGPDVLRVLGALTKAPCYSLQFSSLYAENVTGFDQVGDIFMECITKAKLRGPFIVAGYSAGVFPAYGLALRLQKLGQIRKLIWLDLTFERFRAILRENFGGVDDMSEVDEVDHLLFISTHFFGFDKTLVENMMAEESTYEGKLGRVAELMQEICDSGRNENMLEVLKGSWPMMSVMGKYIPSEKFSGKTALVRTTQNLIANQIGDCWGLEKVCTQTPELIVIDTTHSYLVAEPAVRSVVQLINDTLLEAPPIHTIA